MMQLMRAFVLVLGMAGWGAALAMPADLARHLLERTGFAATPGEVRALEPLDLGEAVDRILASARTEAVTPPPDWVQLPPVDARAVTGLSKPEMQRLRRFLNQEIRRDREDALRGWWLREMRDTPSPLTERMTLFWHNHFATEADKVHNPAALYRQNRFLRANALGSFADLLHGIVRDPAMVRYLDNQLNTKDKPNENLARELLELFSLGEGHYSEQDVREAARALTGWGLDQPPGEIRFRPGRHDKGVKTFLGVSGPLDGEDIVRIILTQDQTARFIVQKLWREFISPRPDEAEIGRLAEVFRSAGYEIKPLMKAMLTSAAFQAPENRGALIKSPVELLVGTSRLLQLDFGDGRGLARLSIPLGQVLFDPPNVRGWPGYTDWIDSARVLERNRILARLDQGLQLVKDRGERRGRKGAAAGEGKVLKVGDDLYRDLDTPEGRRLLTQSFLPIAPQHLGQHAAQHPAEAAADMRRFVLALVLDPAYQLK